MKPETTRDISNVKRPLPAQSPRGRAMYTIDWYLNGATRTLQHDHPGLTVAQLNPLPLCPTTQA